MVWLSALALLLSLLLSSVLCYVFIWKSILIMSTPVGDWYTPVGDRDPPVGDRYPSWRTGVVPPIYAALLDNKYPLAGTGTPLSGTAIPLGGDRYPFWRTGVVIPIYAACIQLCLHLILLEGLVGLADGLLSINPSPQVTTFIIGQLDPKCMFNFIMYVQQYYYLNPEAQSQVVEK